MYIQYLCVYSMDVIDGDEWKSRIRVWPISNSCRVNGDGKEEKEEDEGARLQRLQYL